MAGRDSKIVYHWRKIVKKTPVVFVVNHTTGLAEPTVRPGQEWVLDGEGLATVKFDGQACLWQDHRLWKRYDRKLAKPAQHRKNRGLDLGQVTEADFKVPPEGFFPCEATFDPVSHHWPGWVPVDRNNPGDKWAVEALDRTDAAHLKEGQTYELVGPSLSDNPYHLGHHELWRHGEQVVDVPDRSFEGLKAFLTEHVLEGLVFHHPDGRMAKLRRKDFKLFWVKDDVRDTWTQKPRR